MKTLKTIPTLSIIGALDSATSRIFRFDGRSRRSEYWWIRLIVFLSSLIFTPFVGWVLSLFTIPLTFRRLHDTGRSGWWWGGCAILQLAVVVLCAVDIAALVFAGMTWDPDVLPAALVGVFCKYLLLLIAVTVYKVVLLVFMCIDSDCGANRYGESPKYVEEDVSEP